jgi:hypothetical protein
MHAVSQSAKSDINASMHVVSRSAIVGQSNASMHVRPIVFSARANNSARGNRFLDSDSIGLIDF